ncbi:hypothetical protein SAMN05216548_102292 [Faunimonas pinastri]|uniref:Uncharacterized protein n=1 Tax=Faunimonas pinastri TaxID=1855383 RepID=A0A1H9CYD3_9HYPH|nr:hypothetical protein [Faunimonas pinastri]SEQ06266.1 hypothetical protein SAMN05216548_102292 [Faunimonas pinastri]
MIRGGSTEKAVHWLEDWAKSHIQALDEDEEVQAEALATEAHAASIEAKVYLGSALRALGYKNLKDFMLDELTSRADDEAERLENEAES